MTLDLNALSVTYPGRLKPAVNAVTFGLKQGDIGVLIGPSGCGKTTLLRAVAGLEPVSAGTISLAGQTLSSPGSLVPPEQRQTGMVFQDYALFPHLDVEQNVAFGIMHWTLPVRSARVAEMLVLVGLQGLRQHMPHALSGGQQQRVALARALAPKPRLLLLDEPFSNLDVDLRERLAHEVRGILKAADATALMVTHDQLEAFAMGDVIGVMQNGELHQWADAYTLYHRPSTRFVASFIGHGVFANAQVVLSHGGERVAGGNKQVLTALGLLTDVSSTALTDTPLGPVEVLLRADDIVHDDASPVQAQIIRKAFRGNEFLYTLQLATGETVLAHVPSHHNHKLGEWIGIRTEVDHVVAFPNPA